MLDDRKHFQETDSQPTSAADSPRFEQGERNTSAVANRLHRTGAILMIAGLGLASVSVLVVLPRLPDWGLVGFSVGAAAAVIGTWMKKRFCPLCRAGSCDLPVREERRESAGKD